MIQIILILITIGFVLYIYNESNKSFNRSNEFYNQARELHDENMKILDEIKTQRELAEQYTQDALTILNEANDIVKKHQ